MRTIAVMNQKGGVGKTTTTVNLGATLAELGKRVLLVDLDPQAHLTIGFGIEPLQGGADDISLYNVLVEERPLLEAIQTVDEQIAIVPSSIDLAAAEIELVSILGRETLLKKRVEAAMAAGGMEFDYVLLDCPPSLGLLTLNALAVADEVIVPMQPQFLPLQGMAKLLETVQLVNRRMNPGLKVSGIVLTMFDSQTKLSNEVVAELSGFINDAKGKPLPWSDAVLFKTKIRRNIKLAESPSFGQNILKYDPASNGALDYRNLAKEVVAMSEPLAVAAPPDATTETRAAEAVVPAGVGEMGLGAPHTVPAGTEAGGPALSVQVNRGVNPSQLAAAKADLESAKAEIAAARARIAAAKKNPAPLPPAAAPARRAAARPAVDDARSDTEAVA